MSEGWRLQLAVLLLAGVLWSVYPHASLGAMLIAYALAWVALNLLRAWAPRIVELELTRWQGAALIVALAVAPIARAAGLVDRFLENESLDAIDHRTAARMWLEDVPAIFPPLLSADRPQTFYVHAPDARGVTLTIAGERVEARPLGHGLFRVELDPAELALPERADAILRLVR